MTEPPQKAERRKEIEDPFAQTPRLDIVFKIPPGNTPDWYAVHVLADILGSGQSSRLYQKLVKDQEVAVMARAGADERRGTSLAQVEVMARPGKDLKEIERLVYEEIDRLAKEPVADWELEKARRQIRRLRVQMLQSTMYRAIIIGESAVFYNDPGLINTFEAKYVKVGKEDIRRVARRYLVPSNRTVVVTLPKPTAPAAPLQKAPAKEGAR
jgi:predicted Zn-dependent peptidase